MKKTYTGSCHCGAIQYQAELDLAAGTSRCNCSFCTKARFWLAFAKAEDVKLLRGSEALADYQYAPPGKSEPFLHLHFCRVCGVRPFTKGGHLPAFGGEFYAIQVATLDISAEELAAAPVRYVDGRNDDWNAEPAEHRHL
jgi:hypothetical protein